MTSTNRPPVHESLAVLDFEDIYANEEWRRSVVRYQYDQDAEYDEVAVYLWHLEDGTWKRKNKYVIKTPEAWRTDRQIIDQLWAESKPTLSGDDVPVNDYYHVVAGETVFRTDDWWKAIVKIDRKGSYESDEVMVYVWQNVDGDWRRRQKLTIKTQERWEEERDVVTSLLDVEGGAASTSQSSNDSEVEASDSTTEATSESGGVVDEFTTLSREIDDHLSGTLEN